MTGRRRNDSPRGQRGPSEGSRIDDALKDLKLSAAEKAVLKEYLRTPRRSYSSTVLVLMIDALGVTKSTSVVTPTVQHRHSYYALSNFLEESLCVLTDVFDSPTSQIFAFGDTMCVYDDVGNLEDLDMSADMAHWFVKRSAQAVARLICGNSGLFFRSYVAGGDMYEIDFRPFLQLKAFQENASRIRMATTIGTSLIDAVELDKSKIRSSGLFIMRETARAAGIAVVESAKIEHDGRVEVALVDLRHYLGDEEFRGLTKRLRELSLDEPVDRESVRRWVRSQRVEQSLDEVSMDADIETERGLREFRNDGRHYVRSLLEHLESSSER